MTDSMICCAGITPAMQFLRQHLIRSGLSVTDRPDWNTCHLLLDVPTFRPGFTQKDLDTLLSALPRHAVVWGGNLGNNVSEDFRTVDLLQDQDYLWHNAAITARCAVKIADPLLDTPWPETPVLIIGWGRIGKHLAQLLRAMDCPVTVAARKETDRCTLNGLGFRAVDCHDLGQQLAGFRLIFNTVPAMMIPEGDFPDHKKIIAIDLASKRGLGGPDVIQARGLPGIHAPESAGKLIAETFLKRRKEIIP
ncbi:MAG: hypothetical protein IJO21_03745 [Oscillospiraceae bacterium]|nr:hypothetical protein [Oscillospiraceae bacterium]